MKRTGRIVAFFLVVLLIGTTIGTTTNSIAKDIPLGLDLQGGFEILYEVEPLNEGQEVNDQMLNAVVESLYQRVDILGVNEPQIDIEGDDRIRVQLAGVSDQNEAREILSTTAELSFRGVNDKLYFDGSQLVEGSAMQDFSESNQPIVTLETKSDFENSDYENFQDVTREISQKPAGENLLVIWLDYEEGDSFEEELEKPEEDQKFISAPRVSQVITGNDVMIEGQFTIEEAQQLADILNAGSLPANLNEVYSVAVGAQFGEQAFDKTLFAGMLGIVLIFLYMIAYYRFPGLIATITLSAYIYLILLVFYLINGVLTLPGIAALVLGVGMAVDANIITYERLKEELKAGKTLRSAFKAGNKRSLGTILDANITTILAAIVLFIFGTSSVKGFATMLIISILLSFITAVFGSRLLLGLWVKSKALNKKPKWFGVKPNEIQDIEKGEEVKPHFLGKTFDFVQHRKKFFAISLALLVVGGLFLSIVGLNLGIDFKAGSRVQVLSDQEVTQEEVQSHFDELGFSPQQIILAGDDNEIGMARFDRTLSQEEIGELNNYFEEEYGNQPNVSTVSPQVAEELVMNAIYAVMFASIGIIIYVTFRFELISGVTAIIALLHDAFFILALFSIFQFEFSIIIIAAILTIVGYSINDTIVTFDRIRENLRLEKRVKSFKSLAAIVNKSLMQTLARSFNTVITVVFAALMLFIFGAQAITYFSFALIVGLIAGTYSSLFLAAQLWLVWRGRTVESNPVDYTKKKPSGGPQV
ncbi:protein translocase subunit SecDF [Halalkalibacillus sediminis]|uniref:Multifunctional fusion protein n=1 Tax=Halalkalibacillus sediminis TaxID=2018042 RepID=A0A2I0QXP4_9BACI|nr:protein translocase subunit SecDF [Halalkalibacillus sediminis]PKR79095.1 protein translocase subunit SecDF [Halalkalibacillus sediminis]